MEGRRVWLGMLIAVACMVASGWFARDAHAQSCPSGYTSCTNSDTTWYCTNWACGRPDSGSIESLLRKGKIVGTIISEPAPAEVQSMDMEASGAATAADGAFLEIMANSGNATLMEIALVRRMIMGRLAWVVTLTPRGGFVVPPQGSIAVRAGMRSVAHFHPVGGTVIAELPEFPTRMRVETSTAGTTFSFGFSSSLEVRLPRGTWRPGGSATTDAVNITSLRGSAGGVRSLTFSGDGIGVLRLSNISLTQVEALRSPVFFVH